MRQRPADERGASLITSILGTLLLFATVFVCVELLVTMHRRTVLTGVADDLAHRLARQPKTLSDPVAMDQLSSSTAAALGSGVTMTAVIVGDGPGDVVTVRVIGRGPRLLGWSAIEEFTKIDRTVSARIERPRGDET
jgi:Flp pilus assembly protein TadG